MAKQKMIAVTEELYNKLKSFKKEGKSFSDIVWNLIKMSERTEDHEARISALERQIEEKSAY